MLLIEQGLAQQVYEYLQTCPMRDVESMVNSLRNLATARPAPPPPPPEPEPVPEPDPSPESPEPEPEPEAERPPRDELEFQPPPLGEEI